MANSDLPRAINEGYDKLQHKVARSDEDIARLEWWALKEFVSNESHYPTLAYEHGIRDAFDWLFGRTEDNPADND